MSDIPEHVKEILRREVGYGCPICRSPFLEFHHFDPPRRVEKHNRPAGIIALCPDHHMDADERGEQPGDYSIGELRALKAKNYSADDVRGRFPSWQKKSLLVRVAGVYTDTSAPIFSINGVPQITVAKNEADLLCLSFELRDLEDCIIAKMVDNCFEVRPDRIHDMIVTPKTKDVKVWFAKDDVGLDLAFDRITIGQLQERLEQDGLRARASDFHNWGSDAHPLSVPSLTRTITTWATANCLMDDGLIPFLDFRDVALNYGHKQRVEIRSGIAHVLHFGAEFHQVKAAIALNCHCSVCEPRD
jgi:hypothetical protein